VANPYAPFTSQNVRGRTDSKKAAAHPCQVKAPQPETQAALHGVAVVAFTKLNAHCHTLQPATCGAQSDKPLKEKHMQSIFKKLLCQILVIASIMMPFQTAQAGMIGAEQATSSTSAQAGRSDINNFLNRAETINQLQSMGIDPKAAKARVASMTNSEVNTLAGKINTLPAGADSGLVLLILVVFFIWYFAFNR